MSEQNNVCFLINTYNRHESLLNLIKSIHTIDGKVDIYIVDDGSDPPIQDYSKIIKWNPYIHVYYQGNKGKEYYWQTCNYLFDWVRDTHYKYYYMLPDDVVVPEDFLVKTQDLWGEIKADDPTLITLNLITDRIGIKCWTNYAPTWKPKYNAWKTQWVDMAFMTDGRFFKEMLKIPIIKRDWDTRPMLGSGVGSWISRHFHSRGSSMYMGEHGFVEFQHSHKLSKMHGTNADKVEGIHFVGGDNFYAVHNCTLENNIIFKKKEKELIPIKTQDANKTIEDCNVLIKMTIYKDEQDNYIY